MKFLSFKRHGHVGFGIVKGNGVIDLTGKIRSNITDLKMLLENDMIQEAKKYDELQAPDFLIDEITILPPIVNPEKIICVGVNYGKRHEEYKDNTEAPAYPSIFPRFPGSFVGHQHDIMRPPESRQLDYEGEIVIVIGKAGRRILESDATKHIAGLTCANEGTIRDWLKHGKFNVTQGKNFEASGSVGPWMVTTDEFDDFSKLTVTTRVNGEIRQHDSTDNLMFSFAFLIHYISKWTHLKPGDMIVTGTPIGAGVRFDPPKFLQPGDVVEVEVSGVGILSNTVQDEI